MEPRKLEHLLTRSKEQIFTAYSLLCERKNPVSEIVSNLKCIIDFVIREIFW